MAERFSPKRKKRNRKDDERHFQKKFIEKAREIEREKGIHFYIYEDQDSPNREFSSDWDFLIGFDSVIAFVEMKVTDYKTENYKIETLLRPGQKVAQISCKLAGVPYYILEFNRHLETYALHTLYEKRRGAVYRGLSEKQVLEIILRIGVLR